MSVKKIPLINIFLAIILSIIVFVIMLPAFFTIPAELILFNRENYYPMLENPDNIQSMKDAVANVLLEKLSESKEGYIVLPVFSNHETIKQVIKALITEKWIIDQSESITDQILDFLNFKTTYNYAEISLTEIKQKAINTSDSIAREILTSLPQCNQSDLKHLDEKELSIKDIPACRPSPSYETKVLPVLKWAIEDFTNSLPSSFRFAQLFDQQNASGINKFDSAFYFYSITRWALRLLPIISILLLFFIAMLLRNSSAVMQKWSGKLLVITSSVSLTLIIITLVGLDQAAYLLLNSLLTGYSSHLGVLFLTIFEGILSKALIWIGVISITVLGFGILLIFNSSMKKNRLSDELREKTLEVEESGSDFEDVLEGKKSMLNEREKDNGQS